MASLPVGIILLIGYLGSEGAPLPAADTSISVLLTLVCLIFFFITLVLASAFLLPTLPRVVGTSKTKTATDSSHRKEQRAVWQSFNQIGREYYLRFGPFLSFVLFVFFAIGLIENRDGRWIGVAIGLASFAVWVFRVIRFSEFQDRRSKFEDALQSNAHSLASFFVLFSIIIAVVKQVDPQISAWVLAFVCAGVPLFVHFLTGTLVTDLTRALAAYVAFLMVISILWPGLGFVGGSTLRYIGIGGGIPVSIRVRSYGRTGTVSGTYEMTGCLLLMTGGDVLIRPTVKSFDCKLHPHFMNGAGLTSIETYSRVERYPRADVLRVSKFTDACGTVDGLPSC